MTILRHDGRPEPDVEAWIREHLEPAGDIELAHRRPWSTVLRVPVADGVVWFKACGAVQAFEPRMTTQLFSRWPDRVPEVLGCDLDRSWLLLADAGIPLRELDNEPRRWEEVLPGYAELQRGEAAFAHDHLSHGVPDLRPDVLPQRYRTFVARPLPVGDDEAEALRRFAPRFEELCGDLASRGIPASVQHDDLHESNVYVDGERLRVMDWGDACIGHPFASLVETFRFLEELNGLPPNDPWFARLRDAYLEPWGPGLAETFDLAERVGRFAHAIAWLRQRDHLPPADQPGFDEGYRIVLRRAIARIPA
ncbi:MAG TPA: phosphotransferase [Actinomycetota bacterium]